MTLAVVLLTVLGSFQDAQAMDRILKIGVRVLIINSAYQTYKKTASLRENLEKEKEILEQMKNSLRDVDVVLKDITSLLSDYEKKPNETPFHIKQELNELYAQEDFSGFIKMNPNGFPGVKMGDIKALPFEKLIDKIKAEGKVSLSLDTSLNKNHIADIEAAYTYAAKNYLTKVCNASNALEVQVQKQVLGLEGVTQ